MLGENEGNISLLTRATEKHIVVCGIQKIVPTVLDAVLVAKIQSRINNVPFNYINLISGPSSTSDIRGINVLGMYGAKEVVVILVDEWRTKALKENLFYKDYLKCISCRTCNFVCTAARAFGNIFASKYGWGATAILTDYIHNGIEAAVKDGLFFYKRKWGANMGKSGNESSEIYAFKNCSNDAGISSFLQNNPFVYLEKNQLKNDFCEQYNI